VTPRTVYEAAIELRMSPEGKVLGPEEDDDDADADEDEDEDEDEERVSLDDVPKAVRATIQRRAKGAEIEEIERATEDGETVYEVVIELRMMRTTIESLTRVAASSLTAKTECVRSAVIGQAGGFSGRLALLFLCGQHAHIGD